MNNTKKNNIATAAVLILVVAVFLFVFFRTLLTNDTSPVAASDNDVYVSNINSEATGFQSALLPIEYGESEPVENIYYRTTQGDTGSLMYQVNTETSGVMEVPINAVVIYTAAEGEPASIEKVAISYTMNDGTTQELEQYRITVPGSTTLDVQDAPVEMTVNNQPADPATGNIITE